MLDRRCSTMLSVLWAYFFCLLLCPRGIHANVEKTVFLAPKNIKISSAHPNLADLKLDVISPDEPVLRTELEAEFPTESHEQGKETWLLVEGLNEHQRYEIRICWAATQPTNFWLSAHDLVTVFDTPLLISSLAQFSESRQEDPPAGLSNPSIHHEPRSRQVSFSEDLRSLLFLQIYAAADYYTTNETLMRTVPRVKVDIILDPYLFNVLPRSLAPVGVYIFVIAVASWYISQRVYSWLLSISQAKIAHTDTPFALTTTEADQIKTLSLLGELPFNEGPMGDLHQVVRFLKLQALLDLPLYSLPTEILLQIIKLLDVKDFIAFTIACHHLLARHGLGPAMRGYRWIMLPESPRL